MIPSIKTSVFPPPAGYIQTICMYRYANIDSAERKKKRTKKIEDHVCTVLYVPVGLEGFEGKVLFSLKSKIKTSYTTKPDR